MKTDNEMKENPAVSRLCAFLREGHIDPVLLFTPLYEKPFVRGDVIDVAASLDNVSHSDSVVLQTVVGNDSVVYVTEHGGPFPAYLCTRTKKANEGTLAWADAVDAYFDSDITEV